MTVRPHPKENQIESWEALIEKPAGLEKRPQIRLVYFRCFGGTGELPEHAMSLNLLGRQTLKHRLAGHAEVTLDVFGSNMAFIAREEMNFRPWNFRSDGFVRRHEPIKDL